MGRLKTMTPAVWVAIIAIVAGASVSLLLYWLKERSKPLEFGEAVAAPQRGYDINGVDLRNGEQLKGLYGFPTIDNPIFRTGRETQAPIVRFQVTNRNPFTVTLTSIRIQVSSYRQGKIYVGNGEMVAGSQYRQYECAVEGRTGDFDAHVTDPNANFNVVKANDQESIEIVVRGKSEGVFDMTPVIEYQLGRRSVTAKLNALKPVVFFKGLPPKTPH